MAEENIRCPKCGSKDIDRHWRDKLIKGGAEIVGGFLEGYFVGGSGETGGKIAGGIADELSQKYECNQCGHSFTKEESNRMYAKKPTLRNTLSPTNKLKTEGPFGIEGQNILYQKYKELSKEKDGLDRNDYQIILNEGKKYGLSIKETKYVTLKCTWKTGEGPSYSDLFENPNSFFFNLEPNDLKNESVENCQTEKGLLIKDNEKEYMEELKSIYSEQTEITDRERRLLNRLSKSLGISDERAKELENQVNPNSLSGKEQEYAEEIKACLEDDGVISDRERRILNRLATSLDINPERAAEIEKIIISKK